MLIYPLLSVLIVAGLVLSCMGGGWIVAGFTAWIIAWTITALKQING